MLAPIKAHGMLLPEEDDSSNASNQLLSSKPPSYFPILTSLSQNADSGFFPELLDIPDFFSEHSPQVKSSEPNTQAPIIPAGETCSSVFTQEELLKRIQKLETEVGELKALVHSFASSQTKKRPLEEFSVTGSASAPSKPVTITQLMAAIKRRASAEINRYLSVSQVPINEKGEAEIADLLDKYSRGNIKKVKITPLHLAAYMGDRLIAQALLHHKADPNITSDCGYTPLMTAAGNADVPMAELLLIGGAIKDQTTALGETAFDIAKNKKLRLMPKFLRNYKG